LGLPLREPIVDYDRATFDPAKLAQALHEGRQPSPKGDSRARD
jgi:hypothetical protein